MSLTMSSDSAAKVRAGEVVEGVALESAVMVAMGWVVVEEVALESVVVVAVGWVVVEGVALGSVVVVVVVVVTLAEGSLNTCTWQRTIAITCRTVSAIAAAALRQHGRRSGSRTAP